MSKKTHSAADGYILMEMLAVSASREIKDGEVVFAGTGLPMLAALLAKATHAPNSVMVTEAGIYDPSPLHMPTSVSDSRWYYNSPWSAGPHELMHYFLQAGRIDVGFLGGAQIDRYGNLNSTVVGDYNHPKRRLPGAGGASDIAILSKRTIISMVHEKRRFVDSVDYITTPGWKCWKYPEHELVAREELDMWGGPAAVVSDMGVMSLTKILKKCMWQSISRIGISRRR